ncbi:MAG: 1-acyl-sn-glycerol-3-phosphate acyltransferase [Planctomycetaceae bacterium]|nr:1-acyl-sn-glycerol-3-phosphate acyltransferase [Planctomycetaceae bacterium]
MSDRAEISSVDSSADAAIAGMPHRRNLLWNLIHVIVYLPLRCWLRTRVIGKENLIDESGGVLIANHQSYLDPLFVAVRLTRPVSYLARDSLFKVPLIGWIVRNTFVIPISRTAFRGGSIRTALQRLENGFLVGIYPEGTRSSGQPSRFKPGFLSLVRRTQVPVYPVAIIGADRAMPRGAWLIRPVAVTVVYGKPLTAQERDLLSNGDDDRALAEMMREKVAELYRSVTGESPPHESPPHESTPAESVEEPAGDQDGAA